MGEGRKETLRVEIDRSVGVEFHGANVTFDAGLIVFRELDEALGWTKMVAEILVVSRVQGVSQVVLTAPSEKCRL